MPDLTNITIKQVIDYYSKHRAHLDRVTDDLAVKLGVDPKADTVLVPDAFGKGKYLPYWIKLGTMSSIKHVKGVRRK